MNKKIITALLLAGSLILTSCGGENEKPNSSSSDNISVSSEEQSSEKFEEANSEEVSSSEASNEEDKSSENEENSQESSSSSETNSKPETAPNTETENSSDISAMIDVSVQFLFSDEKPVSNSKVQLIIKQWNTKWEEGEGFFPDYVTDADGLVQMRIPKELLKDQLEFKVTCVMPNGTEKNENVKISLTEQTASKASIIKLTQNSAEQDIKNYKNKVTIKVTKNGSPVKNLNISFNNGGMDIPSLEEDSNDTWDLKYSNKDGEAYFVNPENAVYSLSVEDENFVTIFEADIDLTKGAFDETVKCDGGYEITVKYNK